MSLKVEGAPDGIAFATVSVGNAPVQIVSPRASRRQLLLSLVGGSNVAVFGVDNTVTPTTGFPLLSFFTFGTPIETAAGLWAVSSNGNTAIVGVIEIYDKES